MMRSAIVTLAQKDLRLLLRDPRAVLILVAMPLIFIVVLGVSLGEGFGQGPAKRIRVSICVLDQGPPRFFDRNAILGEQLGRFAATPIPGNGFGGSLGFVAENHRHWYPHDSWADRMLADLGETASIQVELVHDRASAAGSRAARSCLPAGVRAFSRRRLFPGPANRSRSP